MNVTIISVYERPIPVVLLDSAASLVDPEIDVKDTPETPDLGKKLVCHVCQSQITDESERIHIQGKNTHLRTNPAGFTYYFECFEDAPGCAVLGLPTMEHTWFNGYRWQICACKKCGEHLGWLFKGENRFFGLIQGRIISVEK
jgi:hypothetical protein